MAEQLSFREYILKRTKRYSPGSGFVQSAMKDDHFLAVKSHSELDEYLRNHTVAAKERSYGDALWNGYMNAKKRNERAKLLREGAKTISR